MSGAELKLVMGFTVNVSSERLLLAIIDYVIERTINVISQEQAKLNI